MAQRAADRKRMIADLEKAGDPLFEDFVRASERAESATRMARKGGDYPLLSGGDLNLYSLFVERAMTIVKPQGMIGLLTPSGIASDKTAAKFFKGVATEGRLKALYDFENRRTRYDAPPFFPDVDSRFKFCAFIASPSPIPDATRCAFFLQDVSELDDPERCFPLTAEDFALVNPNTGTAPIFRSRRDAALTMAIYGRLPILVDHSSGEEVKIWPVRYFTMFHMTNDSHFFHSAAKLEAEGCYRVEGNCWKKGDLEFVPLYEGKMVQAYDHRAASVEVDATRLHRPGQPVSATEKQHQDSKWSPAPQYYVDVSDIRGLNRLSYILGYKRISSPTNMRSFIACIVPAYAMELNLSLIVPINGREGDYANIASILLANINSFVFDFVTRQKLHGQTLNWFIVEQLPVVPPERFNAVHFGPKTAGEIVLEAVLELTYTANDMAPFARDMGYVDEAGDVRPPFQWDEERRLHLRAKLDAVFFHLYGVTDRDDVRYIYSTFPIVERQETEAYGDYRSRDLCLAYMSALAAGDPDAEVRL